MSVQGTKEARTLSHIPFKFCNFSSFQKRQGRVPSLHKGFWSSLTSHLPLLVFPTHPYLVSWLQRHPSQSPPYQSQHLCLRGLGLLTAGKIKVSPCNFYNPYSPSHASKLGHLGRRELKSLHLCCARIQDIVTFPKTPPFFSLAQF